MLLLNSLVGCPDQAIGREETRHTVSRFELGYVKFHLINKQNKTKQNKTKQNKTKQNKTKQNKTKQNKTKQNKTKQNKTKQNKTKQIDTHMITNTQPPLKLSK